MSTTPEFTKKAVKRRNDRSSYSDPVAFNLPSDSSLLAQEVDDDNDEAHRPKTKRRYCGVPGCSRVVKSQGVCQRHGARTKLCRIEGCLKQAQGSFGGMCKYHFKSKEYLKSVAAKSESGSGSGSTSASQSEIEHAHKKPSSESLGSLPQIGRGSPVEFQSATLRTSADNETESKLLSQTNRDGILKSAIKPDVWDAKLSPQHSKIIQTSSGSRLQQDERDMGKGSENATAGVGDICELESWSQSDMYEMLTNSARAGAITLDPKPQPPTIESVYEGVVPSTIGWASSSGRPMPLVLHLQQGSNMRKDVAWHRNSERAARGLQSIDNADAELEEWEYELVFMEVMLLTGFPDSVFDQLAHAWGFERGFHVQFTDNLCQKRRKGQTQGGGVIELVQKSDAASDCYAYCTRSKPKETADSPRNAKHNLHQDYESKKELDSSKMNH